ncbi:hypothetical protein DTO021C3_1906 [Paecilomyces variotii]|nr:hypothetical protein DTO021C3_1906 [Paecilomyces variotii]KAJ9307156.1 hypothetical protein DTO217A2_3394 [Paecilomyces variotii]KAJ9380056.1 hypothetical protein DTO063F5_6844 [Paecilomyces variotii]KAJ9399451.1 hypothetical protein DTO282F9_3563 [Paecilomyces variotii]
MAVTAGKKNSYQQLLHVSPATSEYQYCGEQHFLEVLDSEYHAFEKDTTGRRSQFFIMSNVGEKTFSETFSSPDPQKRIFSNSSFEYIPDHSLLLVKMRTAVHEQAHEGLNTLIVGKFTLMNGLGLQLQQMGQVSITSNGRTKAADKTYRPKDLPQGRSPLWPTVIIEAGYSEEKVKLADDARWWLLEADGDLKTALTISIHTERKESTVEKWELIPRPTRQDKNKKVAEVTGHIVMSQKEEDPIDVTGHPLTLPFEHFFLRPANPGEGDIILDKSEMEIIAELVWNVHPKV